MRKQSRRIAIPPETGTPKRSKCGNLPTFSRDQAVVATSP